MNLPECSCGIHIIEFIVVRVGSFRGNYMCSASVCGAYVCHSGVCPCVRDALPKCLFITCFHFSNECCGVRTHVCWWWLHELSTNSSPRWIVPMWWINSNWNSVSSLLLSFWFSNQLKPITVRSKQLNNLRGQFSECEWSQKLTSSPYSKRFIWWISTDLTLPIRTIHAMPLKFRCWRIHIHVRLRIAPVFVWIMSNCST